MHWDSASDFFAMGGHGAFVWPAYGVAALVLILLAIASLRYLRAAESDLAAAERAGGRRRSAAPPPPPAAAPVSSQAEAADDA